MAELVSSELECLENSPRTLYTNSPLLERELKLRKLREKRREMQALLGYRPGQPRLSAFRQAQMCNGFDLVKYSDRVIPVESTWGDDYDIAMFGKLGVHCYNFQQGTNFIFLRWEKYNREIDKNSYDEDWDCYDREIEPDTKYYITFDGTDPATNGVSSFQTLVISGSGYGSYTRLTTFASRIRCKEHASCDWDDEAIDEFYKEKLQWFSDHDLATDPKRFYEVQESDLHENDFLQLFSEIAFWQAGKLKSVEKIKKIVIETKEEYISEAREKLKAKNAIYYITYDYPCHPSGDYYTSILRKTIDGNPGHMRIEVASETEEEEYKCCCSGCQIE